MQQQLCHRHACLRGMMAQYRAQGSVPWRAELPSVQKDGRGTTSRQETSEHWPRRMAGEQVADMPCVFMNHPFMVMCHTATHAGG